MGSLTMAVLRASLLLLAITLTSARPQWWNVVDNIKDAAENVVDTAGEVAENAVQGTVGTVSSIKDKAENVVNTVGDVVENTVDTVATSIKDKAENVVDSVGGIAENVVDTVGGVAENVVQGTVDTVSSIKDKTENVADTVGGVAENVVDTVGGVAGNVVDKAENVVNTVANVIDTTQELAQLPFELFSTLSFLSPFNILLSAPSFLINMVSTLLEGFGLDYLTGFAAIFVTTIILVFFKGIAAIALPFEIAAVLGNGLLVIISELVKVLLF